MYRHAIPTLIIAMCLAGCSIGGGGDSAPAPASAVNTAPTVSIAPPGQGALNEDVTLTGNVTDDGLPGSGMVYTWTKISGPGTVTFANGSAAVTSARFSALGSYSLRLEANDGALVTGTNVTVDVIDPYVVVAGTQFDIRVSTGGFASPTAPVANFYRITDTSGGGFTFIARDHVSHTYAAETVSEVPCTRVQASWDIKGYTDGVLMSHRILAQDMALAKDVGGAVRVLRASSSDTTVIPGPAGSDGTWTVDCTSALPVFAPAIASLPAVFTSARLMGTTPGTAETRRIDSLVSDTPNGRGAAYKVGLSIYQEVNADLSVGFEPVGNPQFWQVGVGIVDIQGWTLTPSASN